MSKKYANKLEMKEIWIKIQGQRKLFITGQAKFNPEHYSIKCVGTQTFTIINILCLSVIPNVISLSSLKITLPLFIT